VGAAKSVQRIMVDADDELQLVAPVIPRGYVSQ
jgi:hypothetical protein